ncbi:phospholipase A2-like isoform X1 [Pantherophis guttatus]|uniref:Phospholipase A2-like isoform X1 n=1 Tax=Pantherophis guttatus TaxID=94885 RepID=A0A6P9B9Z0_PANGU|nr:phospholipase A2-like isoform X1 [Pantherophis guttatus]
MEHRLVTLLLFQAVWNGVLGKNHFVNKRGLIELYGTLKCGTSRFSLAYVGYGCYCGPGGRGWPKDETDWCCHRHDCCYDFAQRQGCNPITDRYKWTCQDNTVICDAALNRCQNIICQCDKEAAWCWRFASFNQRYILWPNYLCGQIYPLCCYRH